MDQTSAKDVMQSQVVMVGGDDPLSSVYQLFCDEEISGAPVVNEGGDVVGVISIRDLLRSARDEQETAGPTSDYFEDGVRYQGLEIEELAEDFGERLSGRVVSDVMTPEIISVQIDTPIPEIVRIMLSRKIHRIFVIDPKAEANSLAGIISLFDLVRLLQ